jgi:hypothetical protein
LAEEEAVLLAVRILQVAALVAEAAVEAVVTTALFLLKT